MSSRQSCRGCIVRHLYHHYRGFLGTVRRGLQRPQAGVKDLLYAYRVALTGIEVLETGRIESSLERLTDGQGMPELAELIARKRPGREQAALVPGEAEQHAARLDRLEERLAAAFEGSGLPDEATSLPALDDYVVRARLELGR